jgi:hypothetical protein
MQNGRRSYVVQFTPPVPYRHGLATELHGDLLLKEIVLDNAGRIHGEELMSSCPSPSHVSASRIIVSDTPYWPTYEAPGKNLERRYEELKSVRTFSLPVAVTLDEKRFRQSLGPSR